MQSTANTVNEYLDSLSDDRKVVMQLLRNTIVGAIPKGFHEEMNYGMIGYVVPHSIYPKGYHCTPELPLPFMSFSSQKNSINFYHFIISE
jgi:hypothetical protein